jgi:hypothetical protein
MINYDQDFYGWTQEQAALLRAGRLNELDIINLIEEVETMGRSEKRELQNRLTVLLVHLLKWKYQPARRGRSWQLTIEGQRENCFDVIEDNPSLKSKLEAILSRSYSNARTAASKETGIDKNDFPTLCPWDYDQITDSDYYPD